MPVWTDIERSQSSMVQELHRWWMAHREGDAIPDRSALFPWDITRLLPYLLITELQSSPFRIRYRLVGTKAVALSGFDFTGRYLDELQREPETEPWSEHYRTVAQTHAPLLGSVASPAQAGGTFLYEFAIFPLRKGGSAVAQFIAIEDYFGFQAKSAQWQRS